MTALQERRAKTLHLIQERVTAPPEPREPHIGGSGPPDELYPLAGLSSHELSSAIAERREAILLHQTGTLPSDLIRVTLDRLETEQLRRLDVGAA